MTEDFFDISDIDGMDDGGQENKKLKREIIPERPRFILKNLACEEFHFRVGPDMMTLQNLRDLVQNHDGIGRVPLSYQNYTCSGRSYRAQDDGSRLLTNVLGELWEGPNMIPMIWILWFRDQDYKYCHRWA